jgi:uncharacterized protein (TIGR02118 family)
MYPNDAGARFDHEYYRAKHMPMVKNRMAIVASYTIDKRIAGTRLIAAYSPLAS